MNRIKSERAQLGITQYELARMLTVDNTTLCSWEKGKTSPNATQITKMADEIFGCSTDWLLGLSDTRGSKDVKKVEE